MVQRFLLLPFFVLCMLNSIAQSSKEDIERGLQQMERAGDIRRSGSQIIFLKMKPGDTAFTRELYLKMLEKVENNPYKIAFEIDPKYLTSKQKVPVQVKPPVTNNNQVTHSPTSPTAATNISMPEGRYLIKLSNGRVLEAESNTYKNDGAKVQIWLPYYALNQLWDLKSAGGGKYYFINVASGKTLKVNTTKGIRNGSLVQTWPQSSTAEETKWFIQSAGNQKYTIRSAAAGSMNKVLDVTGGVIDRGGAAIQLWDNTNAVNQSWIFERSYDSAIIRPGLVDLRLNQSSLKHQALILERGSCTYYANLAALEAAYKKRGYGELDLSEEFFSIMSKVMYIEPYWIRVTGSNVRENQMGATQGGGSIFWLTNGLKIPLERNVPFRPSYTFPPGTFVTQREVNDFNTTQLTDSVLNAPLYYSALTGVEFTSAQYLNTAEYERVLDLGYEISVLIFNGSHNIIIIGYDKTDPANPRFLVKDSYNNPSGVPCASTVDRRSYTSIITSPVVGASYITAIREPTTFDELAFMGRWNLSFDGHRGVLDVYHIPGINFTATAFGGALRETEGGTIINADNRIGVFYDEAGNAFRVNGKISGNMMEFYFDLSAPNQRWDQLLGRRFLYYINPSLKIMSGFHYDAGGGTFGGYATKGSYISHAVSEPHLDRLINTEWTLRWGNERGTVRCRVGEDGSVVNGTFNNGTGSRTISFRYEAGDRSTINIRLGDQTANVKFLNHEKGMMCGNINICHQPVLMYKQ